MVKLRLTPWQFPTKNYQILWNWGSLLSSKLTIFDENLSKLVKLRLTPLLKNNTFRRKFVKLRRTPFLKTGYFRRKFVKISEIEAHSFFKNWPFSTKICEILSKLVNLRRTSYLKINTFRRKFVKLRRTSYLKICHFRRKCVKIGELEAHFLIENWPFSTKISEK